MEATELDPGELSCLPSSGRRTPSRLGATSDPRQRQRVPKTWINPLDHRRTVGTFGGGEGVPWAGISSSATGAGAAATSPRSGATDARLLFAIGSTSASSRRVSDRHPPRASAWSVRGRSPASTSLRSVSAHGVTDPLPGRPPLRMRIGGNPQIRFGGLRDQDVG